MLFSSVTFLYYFLPVVLIVYFLVPMPHGSTALRNAVLLAASIVFYMWGEPVFVLVMLGQTACGWVFGLLIEKWRDQPRKAKAALVCAIVVSLAALGFFKYADFFIENVSLLIGVPLAALKIALPIGISFYTFQILSYDIDLYRGNANVQRNFLSFATYVTIFPPLIAGPIVRYVQIENELGRRRTTLSDFADGIRRFVIGLGKKVLIANVLGELVAIYKASDESSVLFVWLYVVAYALHIYFDFSGYSDMAIGIGRMFGFRFPENFNYPYIAASVTDFWRRWHISLSSWFRDYVYIPLGGNRVTPARHIFNILLVWFLTGFWHGAGWNFILWGLFYAAILLLEKYAIGGILARLPILSHLFVILCFLVSWVFFDAATLAEATGRLGLMFGAGADVKVGPESLYYLRSYLVPLIAAGIGATPLPARLAGAVFGTAKGASVRTVAEPVFLAVILITVTAFLVDGSFNPFIYFRF
ncbi:MAG: MBOAT family protein [Clostridiales Family XIII bacterium]|jgi:alginate O-acetyltransferase complex protein AlgI|nr:MBOAT family protein [Clostridiales Family XIII bacterium]